MPLTVDTAPTQKPIHLVELKNQLNMEGTTRFDDYLNLLIDAFTEAVQENLGQQLIQATLVWTVKEWQQQIELPRPPLAAVTSVEYRDTSGTWVTVDPSNYEVNTDAKPGFVLFHTDFSAPETFENELYPWRFTYDAGVLDSTVPADSYKLVDPNLRVWAMNLIGTQFMKREADVIKTGSGTADVIALKAQMSRLVRGQNYNRRFG